MANHNGKVRWNIGIGLPLILSMLAVGGCWFEPSQPDAFYQVETDTLPGNPGDILRVEDYPGAPEGARAWKVLYRSTGLKGEPIAVSGVIVAPEGNASGPKRPVVAWAHGTTGVTSRCAPSLSQGFFYKRIPGLKRFLESGYVIAATDYPGLGTPGPHPYLIGVSEGRAVLDAVRAATRLEQANASNSFVAWGHSQGGHAALFSGQLAKAYAGDLDLAGVAAAAPATDLSVLLHDDLDTKAGKVFTAFAVWSWHRVFGVPLDGLVAESTIPAIDKIAESCLENTLQGLVIAERERAIDKDFLQKDLTKTEPWKGLLVRNSPKGSNAQAPLFLAQGTADKVINPKVTRNFAEAACKAGQPVDLHFGKGLDHMGIVNKGADHAVKWIIERLRNSPPTSDCDGLPNVENAR